MTLLILGLVLWFVAHLLKRVAPDFRNSLSERFGEGSKGIMALLIVISVVLMIIGYRSAEVNVVYSLPSWAGHLNNLLMVIAFFMVGVGSAGSWLGARMRHPMLIGMKIWAIAHLLVNGDIASIVLFGSLLAWAVVSVILINRTEGSWSPDRSVAFGKRDIILIAVWSGLFILAVAIHIWTGHNPFLGAY